MNLQKINNKNYIKHLWLIPFFTGVFIAFLSPTNVLSYKIPNLIVSFMSSIVPMISKLKGDYPMTQIVQFYFSTMWFMSPIVFYSIINGNHYDEIKLISSYRKNRFLLPITFIFFLSIILYSTFIGIDISESYDVRTDITLHTKIGLSTYGFIIPFGTTILICLLYSIKKNFWEILK